MPDPQNHHRPAADLEENAILVAPSAQQEFSDFLADIFRFDGERAPLGMVFESVQSGDEQRVSAAASVGRPLIAKPLQDRIDIRFRLVG